jgi:hypothetical protein
MDVSVSKWYSPYLEYRTKGIYPDMVEQAKYDGKPQSAKDNKQGYDQLQGIVRSNRAFVQAIG